MAFCRKTPVPAENVVVQLAVDCCQAHGIEEGRDCDIGNTFGSDEAKKSLREWGEISDSLMVYGYAACYINRIQPVPNYRSFLNTVRYYAEKANVKGHFADCIGECPSGEFGELKSYIFSKIQWDPYMSEAEMWYHVRDFLIGYYGESAAEYLFEYIKLTVEQVGDKCWENNLGNLKDKDIFFADGTPIDEKLVFIENVKALWDDAKDRCDDATCFERVERAYIQVMFYETEYIAAKHIRVDPTMKDYYDGVKARLAATMSKYGITN
ncbi:MAG: DUF4838 domain-containing protein [Clostridia bacterium]|nr:DUF4838 domain-containing protein [Clostridia bacterium]